MTAQVITLLPQQRVILKKEYKARKHHGDKVVARGWCRTRAPAALGSVGGPVNRVCASLTRKARLTRGRVG